MVTSINNAVLTTLGKVHFNLPLDLPQTSVLNKNWSIGGNYWTTTDFAGENTLNIEGYLESPEALDPNKPHYLGFVLDYTVANEIFWTGYEPPSKTSFFRHIAGDSDFDFITKRASNGKKQRPLKATCPVVSLEYEEDLNSFK